jgi:hypothetical protein
MILLKAYALTKVPGSGNDTNPLITSFGTVCNA